VSQRENETRRHSLRFTGNDIVLAATLMEKVKNAVDIVYYLMDQQDEETFVLMLMKAENIDLNTLLEKEKREPDILFEIDKENSVYAILCQDTKIDGGYRFAERLINKITDNGGSDVYVAELEVRSTSYQLRNIILKLVETFIKAQREGRSGEIIYKSLN
jgi:hypothetical protein